MARFTIVQSAAPAYPTLRSHHVRVGLYRREGGHLVRYRLVDSEVRGERTEVAELAGEQVPDLARRGQRRRPHLRQAALEPTSLHTALDHLGDLADPLPRSLCWAALWDMTRDAELPTRDFVAAVLLHARVEAEVTVLERLLSQALAAIDQSATRPTGRRRAPVWPHRLGPAVGRRAGGDVQLTWARAHIAAADSGDDLDRLERLLDGAQSVPGSRSTTTSDG